MCSTSLTQGKLAASQCIETLSNDVMEAEVPDEASLESLLAAARPFLRGELEHVHPALPSLLSVLRSTGAGECYHKHGTFLHHLTGVHRVLHLWGAPEAVVRCGLFHSSYSNSYVNLSIFNPNTSGRDRVRDLVGARAERLVHLFCVVPRQALMHDDLHHRYTADELRDHLAASHASLIEAAAAAAAGRPPCAAHEVEQWRRKVRVLVPPGGVVTRHIRTGEPVALPRKVVAAFALMTLADLSEQYTDYLTKLFGIENGMLEPQQDNWGVLWPGTGEPGLWMTAVSRLAAVYNLIARDVELDRPVASSAEEKEKSKQDDDDDMSELELVIPPVFARCTKMLDYDDEKAARDLYCEAVRIGATCNQDMEGWQRLETMLRESVAKNPFVGEPWLLLAQVLLNAGRYEEAAAAAEGGLRLLLEWGSSWDKRVSWEGWVSWGRIMRDQARSRQWPRTAYGIINLGLVSNVQNNG